MASFELAYEKAIEDGLLPGIVMLATDKTGDFTYSKWLGARRSTATASEAPIGPDTILAIASCTKLLTAIAVLQCVDRGLGSLDEDICKRFPVLAKIPLATNVEDMVAPTSNQPTLGERKRPITLRHLLTHSSGLGYDVLSPLLLNWRLARGEAPWKLPTIEERCNSPLLFEPGTGWMYSTGAEWAGKFVEHVTTKTLEDYMAANIWAPLGLRDVTFWPAEQEHMKDRVAEVSTWNQDGKCVPLTGFDLIGGSKDCLGGAGLSCSPADYLQILKAVLVEDERLLSKAMWKELFRPQLSEESKISMHQLLEKNPPLNSELGAFVPAGGAKDWGLGGLVAMDSYDGWMQEGTLQWSGMPNIRWFVDRSTGICGLVAAQVIAGEAKAIKDLSVQFCKGIYKLSQDSKK